MLPAASDDQLEEILSCQNDANRSQKPQRSIWEEDTDVWRRELLNLFVHNQLRVSLALPILALIFSAASLLWTPYLTVAAWLACIFGCQALQLYICKFYHRNKGDDKTISEWIGMLAASEFLYAACWSLPLYVFWQEGNSVQHTFLVSILMAVIAVRIMIASNYLPVILAGTGFITFNIAIRCTIEAEPLYIALGAMAIITEIFFIQLSKRLEKTARDMLIFKAHREKLISELEQARSEAEIGRELAEAANRAKSRFLATMSHELRTPLNAIMGFSEILANELMGPHSVEAYREYSDDIHHSGNYLLHLINDILDLSRIEAGKHEIKDEKIDLAKLVADCLKLVKMKAREKDQQLIADIPAELPKLRADERSIRQIWINLLSNAIKFSNGNAKITAGCKLAANNSVSIYVADNGPGMDAAEIDKVMGAFSRGDSATKLAIDGAGLGLAIVSGLAKLHQAEFRLESKPGKGTTAIVTFPPVRVLNKVQEETFEAITTATQRQLVALTA